MNDEIYNRYIQLINKKYNYDFHNEKRYGHVMKLMAWNYNNKEYWNELQNSYS
jgi:hypothetical protein